MGNCARTCMCRAECLLVCMATCPCCGVCNFVRSGRNMRARNESPSQAKVSILLKKASKSQTARARAEQNAYLPAWQLARTVACAILYALGVTCARAMSPRVKQKCRFCSKKHPNRKLRAHVHVQSRMPTCLHGNLPVLW